MQTITIQLARGDNSHYAVVSIDADIKEGLAIHTVWEHTTEWAITHVATGMGLGSDLPTREAAERRRKALLALPGIDWTQGQDHILENQVAIRNVLEVPVWKL